VLHYPNLRNRADFLAEEGIGSATLCPSIFDFSSILSYQLYSTFYPDFFPFTFWFTSNESLALQERKVDVTIVFDSEDFENRKKEQRRVEEVMENIRVRCGEKAQLIPCFLNTILLGQY
jgi:hypothetical protein